jgi:hypothetical protein
MAAISGARVLFVDAAGREHYGVIKLEPLRRGTYQRAFSNGIDASRCGTRLVVNRRLYSQVPVAATVLIRANGAVLVEGKLVRA